MGDRGVEVHEEGLRKLFGSGFVDEPDGLVGDPFHVVAERSIVITIVVTAVFTHEVLHVQSIDKIKPAFLDHFDGIIVIVVVVVETRQVPLADHRGGVVRVLECDRDVFRRAVLVLELGVWDGHVGRLFVEQVPDAGCPGRHLPGDGAVPGGPADRGRRVGLHHLEAARSERLDVRHARRGERVSPVGSGGIVGRGCPFVHEDQIIRLHDDDVGAGSGRVRLGGRCLLDRGRVVSRPDRTQVGVFDTVAWEFVFRGIVNIGAADIAGVTSEDVVPVDDGIPAEVTALAILEGIVDLSKCPDVVAVAPVLGEISVALVQVFHLGVVEGTVHLEAVHGVSQKGRRGDLFDSHMRVVDVPSVIPTGVPVPVPRAQLVGVGHFHGVESIGFLRPVGRDTVHGHGDHPTDGDLRDLDVGIIRRIERDLDREGDLARNVVVVLKDQVVVGNTV